MNYLPSLFCLAKDQCEATVRLIVGALQVPTTKHYRSVFAYQRGLEVGKG